MLENAPGQPLVTEIYTQKSSQPLDVPFLLPKGDSVTATVHRKTFAKPMTGGKRQKLLQPSLENMQQYSKQSQNLRQSVLILHEQSKEKTANAKCYTDQK